MKKEVSLYLQAKRFRRRLKRKEKQRLRRIARQKEQLRNSDVRHQGKLIRDSSDALVSFMSRHFLHLITTEKSPFYQDKLKRDNYRPILVIQIPKEFSILSNPDSSYNV